MRAFRFSTGCRGGAGQASVELLAVLPALVVCVLIAGHALLAGWALWSAANAARAGARAEHVGADGVEAARRSLPPVFRAGSGEQARSTIRVGERGVRVDARVPGLWPGDATAHLRVAARLDPEGG